MLFRRTLALASLAWLAGGAALAQTPPQQGLSPPQEMATNRARPGPIVNGQRRQPTREELSLRKGELPAAARIPDDPARDMRHDAELDDIYKALTRQTQQP